MEDSCPQFLSGFGKGRKTCREGFGENQKTNFVNCAMFGDRVESLVEYLVTGCKVLVEGELALEQYEKDGENRYVTKVYVKGLEIEKFKEEKKVNKYSKKGAKK